MDNYSKLPSLSALTVAPSHRLGNGSRFVGTPTPSDDSAFTRCSETIHIGRLGEWPSELQSSNPTGYRAFVLASNAIERKKKRLCAVVSKQLALLYRQGLEPFPTHFEWSRATYELAEPEAMNELSQKGRKNWKLLKPVLESLAQGESDAFATLIIALTTAKKIVTHWSELDDDDDD